MRITSNEVQAVKFSVALRGYAADEVDAFLEIVVKTISEYEGLHGADGLLAEQDLIVPSPGVPWDLPGLVSARQRGVAVCGELELAAGALRGRVISCAIAAF